MISRAVSYDRTCHNCSSQGFALQYDTYKDIDYYVIRLGTDHSSISIMRLCDTCIKRLYREYERIKNE